jgi:hypothetical protein
MNPLKVNLREKLKEGLEDGCSAELFQQHAWSKSFQYCTLFCFLGHLLLVMMMRSYLEVSVSLLFCSLSSNATIPCATTTSAKEQQHLYILIVQARIAFCLCCPCCGIFMSLQKDWHTRQTDTQTHRSKQCLIVPDLDWPSTTEEACEM